jgi:hypothetical protein
MIRTLINSTSNGTVAAASGNTSAASTSINLNSSEGILNEWSIVIVIVIGIASLLICIACCLCSRSYYKATKNALENQPKGVDVVKVKKQRSNDTENASTYNDIEEWFA